MTPISRSIFGGARSAPGRAAAGIFLAAFFTAGLALALVMVARSQVSGDQLNLLARGWRFVVEGEVVPYGNPTSAGGKSPGSLSSLLVGLPLAVWSDFRAPALLTLLFHIAAYCMLDRLLAMAGGRRERLLFALFYWLNPWQLYFASHLWNANWVGLLGAIHMVTAWGLRERPAFWPSLFHGLAIGICAQLHPAFVILFLATLALWATRQIRLNIAAGALAVALTAVSVLPWAMAVLEDPGLLPGDKGYLGRGLILVFPLLRGIGYFLRYSSLMVAGRMILFDFTPALGPGADAVLAPLMKSFAQAAGILSLAAPLLAHRWFWPRLKRRFFRRGSRPASGRLWLAGYAGTTLAAALVASALSPTTFMLWQGFVVLHAAVLPVVLVGAVLWRSRRGPAVRRWLIAYAAASLIILAAMTWAAPMYRKGGRDARAIAMRADHPMLHELNIAAHCTVPLDPIGGWWPDVLPEPGSDSGATSQE